MREIQLDMLKAEILKPGIERHLMPLTEFRGKTIGGVHRMWNYSISMMVHDATLSDATQRLGCNEVYSQLCMPIKRPSAMQIGIFTGALSAAPQVAYNQKGLLDYLRGTSKWIIDPYNTWHRPRDTYKPYASDNPYPFLVHDAKRPLDPLVELITAAIPKYLDREMKADLCQELAVAILCGDLSRDDLRDGVKKFMPKLWKMNPSSKYGAMSLDAQIPGDENGRTWLDVRATGTVETF